MKSNQPKATIISGLPLSGKTTFLATLYQNGIAQSRNLSLKKVPDAMKAQESFTVEGDFSDYNGRALIQVIKDAGYTIVMYVLHVDDEEIAALNLVRRVQMGGKDSIMRNIIKKYNLFGNDGFWRGGFVEDGENPSSIVEIADEFYFYENSVRGQDPSLMIAYHKGILAFMDDERIVQDKHQAIPFHIRVNTKQAIQPHDRIDSMKAKIDAAMQRSFNRLCRYYYPDDVAKMARPLKPKQSVLIAYLVSTTNHGLAHYGNIVGRLIVSTYARWIGDLRDETFHTSSLRGYELKGSQLTLYTLNSTYVFEIIAGEFDTFAFTRANQDLIDEYDAINAASHELYLCQIASGFGMIDGAITVVELPYAMNLQEARDYLCDHLLTDNEGNLVTNIMGAYTQRKKR